MSRPTKFHSAKCSSTNENRFLSCVKRKAEVTEEDEGVFDFEDLAGCTVIPKDIFISSNGKIIRDTISSRKLLYSKPI